jgi:CPA2 family monovalent cation:H+ antiporter-2
MGLTTDIIYIVFAALVGGLFAHALRQPLICGYILAGIVVGPYTGGLTVQNIHDIEMLAEIGVALLLFTLGLEFSFGELKRFARVAFVATPIQIAVCAVGGFLIAMGLGLTRSDAVWLGAAVSLSSTMVVLKTLTARHTLQTQGSRIMLTILIAQDMAIVPIMLLAPQLTGDVVAFAPILWAVLKSFVFLVFMYVAGTRILPQLFTAISRQGSRELFFLSTLAVAFGAGLISYWMGLSFALGAFVAGMLLSETEFNQQALSDISTLRDLFALIFFVSVGMLFDPTFFVSHVGTVLLLALAVMASKAIFTAGSMMVLGYDRKLSVMVGFGLAQVGEFAFVIVKAGSRAGYVSHDSFSLMIAVTVVTMIATPVLFYLGERVSASSSARPALEETQPVEESAGLVNHVVVIGGGVVGQYVARALSSLNHPYVVIESDHKIVTSMRERGMNVIFGDGSRRTILEGARVSEARLVIVTTTNGHILPLIVAEVNTLRPKLPIVVRVEEVEDIAALSSLKVEEIVQPQLEVGLEMVRQALRNLRVDEATVLALLEEIRADRYRLPTT